MPSANGSAPAPTADADPADASSTDEGVALAFSIQQTLLPTLTLDADELTLQEDGSNSVTLTASLDQTRDQAARGTACRDRSADSGRRFPCQMESAADRRRAPP